MEQRKLGKTGLSLSIIGFGAAPLGNEYGAVDLADGERAVHAAIDAGITFFDTSPYYGRALSEQRLGKALEGRRDSVVLSTKCGRYDFAGFDFSAARVTASIDESLRRLRTDYLDIFIAHDIEFGDSAMIVNETVPAMRALQKAGKARSIGISGLPVKLLARVAIEAQVDLVLSYCHYNLMVQDLDRLLAPALAAYGIGLINASALHMGMLTSAGPPRGTPLRRKSKMPRGEWWRHAKRRASIPRCWVCIFRSDTRMSHPRWSASLIPRRFNRTCGRLPLSPPRS